MSAATATPASTEPGRARRRGPLERGWPLLAAAVLVVCVSQLGVVGGPVLQREVVLALIYLVVVLGLHLFIGLSGVFSFCHVGFMAIGAYTTALLLLPVDLKIATMPEMPALLAEAHAGPVVATLAGAAVAGFGALVVSLPLMRLSGLPASLATLAVLMIINIVASNLTPITNADAGLAGLPTDLGVWTALIWVIAVMALVFAFQGSAVGLRLRASRENGFAARASGIRIAYERRIAFVVSGAVCGLAGGLYAQYIGSFNADAFFLPLTFLTIVMLVVGGLGSMSGAVVGVVAISVWSALLSQLENGLAIAGTTLTTPAGLQEVGLALMMLGILILLPAGILRGDELPLPRRLRRDGGRTAGR